MTPVHKKEDSILVKYHPVSVLTRAPKTFERIFQSQVTEYVVKFLFPLLCGCRKGYSTKYVFVSLVEKWKFRLDKKGYSGGMLMDHSEAFDTINHELLIAKLHAYGFSKYSLILISSYLSNRWQ